MSHTELFEQLNKQKKIIFGLKDYIKLLLASNLPYIEKCCYQNILDEIERLENEKRRIK